MTTIKSSNTDNQVIENFDLGKYQSVQYRVQTKSKDYTCDSNINIVHDGVNSFITQDCISLPELIPQEFDFDLSNYIGEIKTSPNYANSQFTLNSNKIESQLYGEHLLSGRIILGEEGFGVDLESAMPSITIRSSNNHYVSANTYITNNVIGPTLVEDNLMSDDWKSYNYSEFIYDDGIYCAKSSGQKENFQYQEIDTVPGKVYKLYVGHKSVYPENSNVKENSNFSRSSSFIRISNSLTGSPILSIQSKDTQTFTEECFIAQSDKTILSFGYGERNIICKIASSSYIKESTPLFTFDQNKGILYLQWDSLSNNSQICSMSNLNIIVNSNNEVQINDSVLGDQTATNKLALSIDDMEYCLNSNTGSLEDLSITGVNSIEIGNISKLSYSPNSNNQLIEYMDV